ncbi:MAG: YcnI family protein [Acidimicrobiales bacterium]|nr:YcnI family protein [Acidimicrobiales bacterium]
MVAAVTGVLMFATPASAHVTVHPATVPAGTSDIELTFRVPNERDNASTVRLQVYFPSDLPLLTVDVRPIPGWTASVDTRTLRKPVQTDDGPVGQVVSDVTWTATNGGITPGQYEDFDISAGKVPDRTGTVIFKALQTYSSGEIVRWIQVADSQDPSPDTPAPVLTLTSPGTSTATATTSPSSSTTQDIAVAAIVMAGAALIGVAILLVRRGRRAGAPRGHGAHSE